MAARGITASSLKTGLSAQLDETTGDYRITAQNPSWSFAGSLGSAPGDVREADGNDRVGAYRQLTFTWQDGGNSLEGAIRLYQDDPLVLFQYTYLKAATPSSVSFPSFSGIPTGLHHFSYQNVAFAAPQFELGQYGTPWLLFDDHANAMIISPASHFIIASMHGDGDHLIASGLDQQLPSVPEGFTQQTLMAISPGIRHTWDTWGTALINLEGRQRSGNESDITLKYFGYWTDNGAAYYYRYDPTLGYTGTLKAVIARYREEKIPVRYLQLDSWWYDKSSPGMSADDHTGTWNARGGTMLYQADASLFPQGLAAFQKSVALPLVVHGRYLSEQSPYRQEGYDISGVAPVGAKWWNEIGAYLQANGVITYEQDWNSLITQQSPAFSNTIATGHDFYDHMAEGTKDHQMTMQYCMALPSDFLEGSGYGNLTSIRTSGDRFSPAHWSNFIYTSQLAYAIGTWPWTDVYFSRETTNLLVDTLSAGPVGTGDALGAEDRQNIMMAVRGDGVIVKPDVPLIPLDRIYVADAAAASAPERPRPPQGGGMAASNAGSFAPQAAGPAQPGGTPAFNPDYFRRSVPFIGNTWTDDGPVRTSYVFAFSRSGGAYPPVSFTPEDAGTKSPAYVYDYFTHQVSRVGVGENFEELVGPGEAGYYIVAPVSPSGMAFFGDEGKIASMGKERIASLEEGPHSITAEVLFADGEDSVTLFGDAPSAPTTTVRGGSAGAVTFRKTDGYFSVEVSPSPDAQAATVDGDPVRRVTVVFTLP